MHDIVKDYYGRRLQHSDDLKTSACRDISQVPAWLKPLLAAIHPEVLARYYGCGLVCPPLLAGCRLFKLDGLESACEDYGQAVIYRGNIPGQADHFVLDKHHGIESGKTFPVCGNTWRMLHDTRFAAHFDFIGDFSRHFGWFEGCGGALPFDPVRNTQATPACC